MQSRTTSTPFWAVAMHTAQKSHYNRDHCPEKPELFLSGLIVIIGCGRLVATIVITGYYTIILTVRTSP